MVTIFQQNGVTDPSANANNNPAFQSGGVDAAPILPGQNLGVQPPAGFTGGAFSNTGLPPAQVQNNANGVTPTPTPQIPQNTPTTGDTTGVDGLTAYYKSLFDTAQKQASDAKDAETAAKTQQTTQSQPFLSKLLGASSISDTRTAAQTATGVDPASYFADEKARIAEIDTLNQQYNAAKANVDQQVANLTGQGRGIPQDLLNNQAAQIQRNAAPGLNAMSANINSKAAALQASQGMFAEAQNYVDKAVSDATADLKFNSDMYQTFYTQNQSTIDNLDSQYQTALKTATDAAQNAYTVATQEKTAVGALMINPNYAGAGISITDSLAQAQQKASTWAQTHPNANQTQSSIQDIGGRKVAVTLDATGKVINQVDLGSSTNPNANSYSTEFSSILANSGASSTWTPQDWNDTRAGFISRHTGDLGATKAASVFDAQFPKPAAVKPPSLLSDPVGYTSHVVGSGINYLKNLF